jgi:hypothetical protein
MIGGVTAGVMQHIRGGSFSRGFVKGMLGGGIVWAGKLVAAQRFSGSGFLGREVAAVGSSMVHNTGSGQSLLEELVLPVGPIRLYVRPGARVPFVPKVDVLASAWLAYGIVESELDFDAGESISSGAPVFRTDGKVLKFGSDSMHAAGLMNAGVIFVADVPAFGSDFTRRALAHERVHVIQGDQLFLWWTDPAEEWVVGKARGADRVLRHVDFNLSTNLLELLGRFFPEHGDRPWEMEAIFLTR